jgi:hypothetical protein
MSGVYYGQWIRSTLIRFNDVVLSEQRNRSHNGL